VSKEPWELYPTIWKTKAAFFTYLRGHLRLLWSRYPAKLKWKQSKLVTPPLGYTGRAKKLGQCHYCGEWHAASMLEVDHVHAAGQCNSWETAQQFLRNLLDCNDNWVLADKVCHKIKSYSEAHDLTFEQARTAKTVIDLMKPANKQKMLDLLSKNAYNCKNSAERKKALIEILTKENV
jgi:hypothetical protein